MLAKRAVADLVEMVTGELRIGASFTIGEYVLPRVLAAFSKKYPQVKYSVTIGNTELIHERALEGSIDLGVVEGHIEDKQLIIEEFSQDEMVFIVSKQHPLAKSKYITREDLENETFIMREEGSGTRIALEEVLQEISLKPVNLITLGSTQAIKEAVEAGMGVAMLSKWALRKELKLGTLKIIRIKDLKKTRSFTVVRRKERFESKACYEFRKYIMNGGASEVLTLV
ncbi:LysR substrate-binding domain-containing protein [Pelotomaculum propionicicum]|uniref:HTH-type transcriptional regulator CysL n=1 Tax=Pelotomaculum propionicicum TaxID=258475 RepID=A0A4Y7RMY1_9FIRM|nr:LysR substrate-binding domain-containing protein [Pelotomaculum propionicicum]TEB10335.1 HTH-type transcriptional regulator CysL [Pelotomaculum propionicicum]